MYNNSGEFVATPEKLSVKNLSAWRQGKLIFDNCRLDEVLAEMGRYHNVQLQLSDEKLANNKVSGSFFIRQTQTITLALLPVA
jgi:transmembrane sensor